MQSPEEENRAIRRMLAGERIAIVGLSDDAERPSHQIAEYLRSAGKLIFPVNPNYSRVMGLTCYRSLADVPQLIDVVNVFRRPEYCGQIAREAIEAGAKGIWLQSGIRSAEAERLAAAAGIDFVHDRCIMIEHANTG